MHDTHHRIYIYMCIYIWIVCSLTLCHAWSINIGTLGYGVTTNPERWYTWTHSFLLRVARVSTQGETLCRPNRSSWWTSFHFSPSILLFPSLENIFLILSMQRIKLFAISFFFFFGQRDFCGIFCKFHLKKINNTECQRYQKIKKSRVSINLAKDSKFRDFFHTFSKRLTVNWFDKSPNWFQNPDLWSQVRFKV